ncbi:hypothetical protein C453_17304 [Haloferax elongans ATCC BAA-1513]|uniref:DUF4350 domain-containing protein n=1 Tax=Haloferax elongans ATCC BAA-1513 TaxID=1230453 RepID=M0HBC2_HALEO|nr:DUF4350 domain-containing protein [Haloferax elongans]ELZ81795.1 hypothetical protein C453_17304 [Haloferax elongans ATCC BAA-1513]
MSQRNLLGGVAVFVVVVALIVVGAAIVPYAQAFTSSEEQNTTNIAKQQYDASELVVTPAPDSGTVTMDSNTESKTVVIDVAHENDVSEKGIQPLVDALVANGHNVKYLTRDDARQNFNSTLRKADAFVVVNPERTYETKQLDALRKFEDAGGRVALIGDPQSAEGMSLFGLFAPMPRGESGGDAGLTSDYGITFGSSSLYNMHDYYLNHQNVYATPQSNSSLTDGVDKVVFRDAAPVSLSSDAGSAVLATGAQTKIETSRQSGPFTVAVQGDNVVAIGDSDFMSTQSAYEADNEVLIGNLADFLVTGDKTEGAPAPVSTGQNSGPPRAPA